MNARLAGASARVQAGSGLTFARMRMPEFLVVALDRARGVMRAFGEFVRDRSSVLSGSMMRVLGKLRLPGTPRSLQLLAQDDIHVDHYVMGKSDLNAVMERRSEIAREVAALEAMRAEMEAEDQELLVAERVLRRLSDAPMSRRAEAPAMASNEV